MVYQLEVSIIYYLIIEMIHQLQISIHLFYGHEGNERKFSSLLFTEILAMYNEYSNILTSHCES